MGSTSIASFLARLLRPDRKDSSSQSARANLRKRHSAPVPSWFDVTDPTHIPPPSAPIQPSPKGKKFPKGRAIEDVDANLTLSPQLTNTQNLKNNNNNNNNNKKKKKQQKQKKNKQSDKDRKSKSPDVIDITNVERRNKENKKDAIRSPEKVKRRHSSGLAYWFCVSANADTLERGLNAPYAQDRKSRKDEALESNKHGRPQDLTSIPEQNATEDGKNSTKPVSIAGVIRREGKKKKGDPKNRHSAPAGPATLAVFRPKERPLTPNQYHDILTYQRDVTPAQGIAERVRPRAAAPSPTRSVSPGVRYRVDGTLERPYVFPSGLTFGADGRKTKLRSTSASPITESPMQPLIGPNTSTVVVDVHDASREGNISDSKHRYYHSSDPNIADLSYDDFDVRKAFYLKYDSDNSPSKSGQPSSNNVSGSNPRYSMPVFPATYQSAPENHFKHDTQHDFNDPALPRPATNRYSMPPHNEEFVYMGSRDNLNVWNDFIEEHKLVSQAAGGAESSDIPNETKRRYSSPVHNTEYVYMGSIENIHLLNAGDKRAGVLSLKRDLDAYVLTGSGAMPVGEDNVAHNTDPGIHGSSQSDHDESDLPLTTAQDVSAHSDGVPNRFEPFHQRHPVNTDECHHSLPELSTNKSLTYYDDHENSEVNVDGEEDMFVSNTLPERKPVPQHNPSPFSRNIGRSSCMPGNKRSFAPPPAIFSHSDTTVQLSGTTPINHKKYTMTPHRAPFMPGNKHFKLPPPPNYTPPREEMEDAHAALTQLAAREKGSQTNLHDSALYTLNMEDRDMSLPRDLAKTIRSSVSLTQPTKLKSSNSTKRNERYPESHKVEPPSVRDKSNTSYANQTKTAFVKPQDKTRKLLNTSTTSSQGSDDVFKDGSVSDSTWAAERFKPSRNAKYSFAGVAPKIVPIISAPAATPKSTSNAPNSNHPTSSKDDHERFPLQNTDQVALRNHTIITESTSAPPRNISFLSSIGVVTSTPKIVRRERPTGDKATSGDAKPVPTPRKRYSTLGLCGYSSPSPVDMSHIASHTRTSSIQDTILSKTSTLNSCLENGKNAHRHTHDILKNSSSNTTASTKTPPIPKKRRNVSRSQGGSDSCFSSPEDTTLNVKGHIHLVSVSNPPETESKTNECKVEQTHSACKDIVEDLTKVALNGSMQNENNHAKSPDQINKPSLSLETNNQNPEINKQCDRDNSETFGAPSATGPSRPRRRASLDDTCIADDELSCLEGAAEPVVGGDDPSSSSRDTTMKRRRRSMRKCVSVDDLLRSGSILDRSLIIARKRRRRMRDRKCQSQVLLSSSDDEEAAANTGTGSSIRWADAETPKGSTKRRSLDRRAVWENNGPNITCTPSQNGANAGTNKRTTFGGSNPTLQKLEFLTPKRQPWDYYNSAELDSEGEGRAGFDLRSMNGSLRPWEIGLENMNTHHNTSPVRRNTPRWRKDIVSQLAFSAMTGSARKQNGSAKNGGVETVV